MKKKKKPSKSVLGIYIKMQYNLNTVYIKEERLD